MMKKLKKRAMMLMSGSLALTSVAVPILTIGTPVYAAENRSTIKAVSGIATMGSGPASIRIDSKQSTVNKKFMVYKLFDAENSDGMESINYTVNPLYEESLKEVVAQGLAKRGTPVVKDKVTEYMIIDYMQSLNTYPAEGAQADQKLQGSYSDYRYFIEQLRTQMIKDGVSGDMVLVESTKEDNSVLINGLDYGYYLVDEVTKPVGSHSAGSLCIVGTSNPEYQVNIKSDYPSVTKKIQEDDKTPQIKDAKGWNDIGDYEIGQTVPYKYTSNIPNMNGYHEYYYAWHDKMDESLTFNPDSVQITIKGKDTDGKEKTYTLSKDEFNINTNPGQGETFKVEVDNIKKIVDREFHRFNEDKENEYGQEVVLHYNATLNDKAAEHTGCPGFENDVRLEFSNDADIDNGGSTGFTPWDTVVCFTYKLNVVKENEKNQTLKGAKFRLYSDPDCKNEIFVKKDKNNYIVINRDSVGGTDHTGGEAPAEAVEMVTPEDGKFTVFGLDSGTYYLKETKAPAGYRLLKDPIVLKLTATFTDERDSYVKGDSMSYTALNDIQGTAHVKSFFDGIFHEKDNELESDLDSGSVNLTVVNQTGKKLPVTGTSAALVVMLTGTSLMGYAFLKNAKKKKEER